MVQQKDEAERLRFGVRGGWIEIDAAIAWADRQIEQTSQPHSALVDLALAQNRSREEVAALLESIPGSADLPFVMRWCLSDLLATVGRDPSLGAAAARWLESAALRGDLPKSDFGAEAFMLADVFSLAEQGTYGTVGEAMDRLLVFLRQYARREA
jgi:hypothetical protein